MPLYSRGRSITIVVGDFETASQVGQYMSAVRQFTRTNDPGYLKPFVGRSVRDVKNKRRPFETNPNTLYQLTSVGEDVFEQVYRVVI